MWVQVPLRRRSIQRRGRFNLSFHANSLIFGTRSEPPLSSQSWWRARCPPSCSRDAQAAGCIRRSFPRCSHGAMSPCPRTPRQCEATTDIPTSEAGGEALAAPSASTFHSAFPLQLLLVAATDLTLSHAKKKADRARNRREQRDWF